MPEAWLGQAISILLFLCASVEAALEHESCIYNKNFREELYFIYTLKEIEFKIKLWD